VTDAQHGAVLSAWSHSDALVICAGYWRLLTALLFKRL
jgi:hypothetical protein